MGCIGIPKSPIVSATSAPTLTYVGSATATGATTVINFGSFTVPDNGLVIVAVGKITTNSVIFTGSDMGSYSMGVGFGKNSGTVCTGWGWQNVTTGGSLTLTATMNGASGATMDAGAAVWFITGFNYREPAWRYDASEVSTASNTFPLDAGICADGHALYYYFKSGTAAITNHAWSNATVDRSFTTGTMSNNRGHSAAHRTATTSEIAPYTETVSWTTSSQNLVTGGIWR